MSPTIGTTDTLRAALADRYLIEREIGRGGMAVVYGAQDIRHGRQVAIKVFNADVGAAVGAARFQREIHTLARLAHPHILPLYDSGQAGDSLFYVMPFITGESLRQRIKREGPLPLADVAKIVSQVGGALGYAHKRGVIHRDVKPENILFEEGHAIVADFGIARDADTPEGERLTTMGVGMGTPAYMSPEQASGEWKVDARSDVYALGCVAHEMIAGAPPFSGASWQSVLLKHLTAARVPVGTLRSGVPPSAEQAILRATAVEPEARFESVTEFAESLARALTSPTDTPSAVSPSSGSARLPSIAVLPFVNMSADPDNEYFSDGMTEEIISRLARLGRMRVVSRTSAFAFKGKNEDVRRIGERLEVASVLEGSVRKIGNRLRVTAQLIDVGTGYDLWSETYDRTMDDAFAVQDDITRAIVDRLKVRLLEGDAERVATREPVPANAYNEYLRGRFLWNQRTSDSLLKSVGCFERAIAEAPTYALAHAGLADAYNMLGFYEHLPPRDAFPRAQAAARHALALDDKLGEAHAALAYSQFYFDWKFADAEQSLTRATELNPGYAIAYHYLGNLMASRQRFDESAAAFRKALTLDPLSLIINSGYSWSLYQAGRYEDALDQAGRALELDARFMLAHFWYGLILLALGRSGESIAPLERAVELSSRAAFVVASLAYALAKTGDSTRARTLLEEVTSAKHAYVPSFDVALVYLALGETQPAVQNLERALEERSHSLVFLGSDARVAPLLSDPRVQAIRRVVDG
ncbi:MAG TPA: protein kinase [Gemmatimonadaceae bacterium]|nr:protein kinase [Gemmatimonadaceae bacterium]